jgi:hypothetical protein
MYELHRSWNKLKAPAGQNNTTVDSAWRNNNLKEVGIKSIERYFKQSEK